MHKTLIATAVLGLLSASAFAANRSDPGHVPTKAYTGPVVNAGGTCPTPPAITSLPFSDSSTTCSLSNTVSDYNSSAACSANLPFPYPGEDTAYAITVGTGQSLDISADLTGSTGDLALFLLGTCGSGASCIDTSQDAVGSGAGPETISTQTGLAPGTYYIYVDSYYAAGNGNSCGSYTLSVAGTLPVQLQSYGID
jgi:hypothetical protein